MNIEEFTEPFIPTGADKNDNWAKLPHFMRTNEAAYKDLSKEGATYLVSPEYANLVTSKSYMTGGVQYHTPILDLDMDAALVPSTTVGHYHLYIDKVMPEEDYRKLIDVLVEVGILQSGIKEHQMDGEGFTAARLPGISKKPEELSSGKSMFVTSNMLTEMFTASTPQTLSLEETPKEDPLNGIAGILKETSALAEVASKTGQNLQDVLEAYQALKGSINKSSNEEPF